MPRKKQDLQQGYKLFESNDIAKYGILTLAGKLLSPLEYKTLLYLIWKGAQTGEFTEKVEMPLSELCFAIGYSMDSNCNFSHAKKKVCNVIDGLMSKKFRIHDADAGMFISFVLVQTAVVSYKDDFVSVHFNSDLARFFGQEIKKNFTVVRLKYMNRLKTSPSITLYQFFCRYRKMHTFNYGVGDLAKLLTGDCGFDYKYLKRDYITPAVKAINQQTDLHVEFYENKKDRKVISLNFVISLTPSQDELECHMDYRQISCDELNIIPYDSEWMNHYTYDMATQRYIQQDMP